MLLIYFHLKAVSAKHRVIGILSVAFIFGDGSSLKEFCNKAITEDFNGNMIICQRLKRKEERELRVGETFR